MSDDKGQRADKLPEETPRQDPVMKVTDGGDLTVNLPPRPRRDRTPSGRKPKDRLPRETPRDDWMNEDD